MCILLKRFVCNSSEMLIIKDTLANHGMTHDAKMELKTPFFFYKMWKFCESHTLASTIVRKSLEFLIYPRISRRNNNTSR